MMKTNRLITLFLGLNIFISAAATTNLLIEADYKLNVVNNEYIEINEFKNKDFDGELIVPDSFYVYYLEQSLPVKSIGPKAFSNCPNVTACIMPSGIESIGSYAFSNCGYLTTVDLSESVTTIGSYAFSECLSLSEIKFSPSVKTIESYAFYRCKSLESVDLPASLTSIGAYAFSKCSAIRKISFPSSLISIGAFAFDDCKKLTSVKFPDALTSIKKSAFMNTGLTEIKLPTSITEIEERAFANCPGIKEVDLSECNIEYLYPIFGGSTVLESVALPRCLIALEGDVFVNMQIASIDFPESLDYIGYGAFWNNPIERVDLKHVSNVCASFKDCKQLTDVEWSDQPGARYDYEAFNGTSLSEVIIGKNVCSLSHSPFGNIQTLRSVKCFVADPDSIDYGVSNPPLPGEEIDPGAIYSIEVFKGSDLSQCILWVPEGSLELYRNYPMWRDFPDIREMDAAGMPIIKDEQAPAETSCFDLQGRKVTDPQPGNVYIVNGRKLLHRE